MSSPAQRLALLRERRVFKDRAAPVKGIVVAAGAELRQLERRLGGTAGAWASVCPPELVGGTSLVGLNRGVLTVRADDASTRFEIDRWLRSGGERELVKRCPSTIRKVRVVIGGESEPAGRRRV